MCAKGCSACRKRLVPCIHWCRTRDNYFAPDGQDGGGAWWNSRDIHALYLRVFHRKAYVPVHKPILPLHETWRNLRPTGTLNNLSVSLIIVWSHFTLPSQSIWQTSICKSLIQGQNTSYYESEFIRLRSVHHNIDPSPPRAKMYSTLLYRLPHSVKSEKESQTILVRPLPWFCRELENISIVCANNRQDSRSLYRIHSFYQRLSNLYTMLDAKRFLIPKYPYSNQ